MRRNLYSMLLLSVFVFFMSCSNDDDKTKKLSKLTVQITSDAPLEDLSVFQVTVTDLKSGITLKEKADRKGKVLFELAKGAYNIAAEDAMDGVCTMYGHAENFVVGDDASQVNVKVVPMVNALEKSCVLDELYFNGDKNGEWNQVFYESYITIRNVSSRPLYADGLSIAICGNYNSSEEEDNAMAAYLKKDTVVISQLFTIPGNGRAYKVEPGESLVLAHSAINHKLGDDGKTVDETKVNSIDLSGANFEFYVEGAMTPDNPEVPNMMIDFAANEAFNWGYDGGTPIMLVRLTADERAGLVKNKENMVMPKSMGTMKLNYLLLPVSKIIDGVETGAKDNFFHKVLPDRIDRSSIQVNTAWGFDGQFIRRKQVSGNGGKMTVADTNSSADDFEIIVHGQKSYPKK